MSNPESFVIDKINRLETAWNAQDEWIEQSFEHGRLTGEYYGQTGTEHLTVGIDDARDATYTLTNDTVTYDMPRVGIEMDGVLHIYGVITDGSAIELTICGDAGAVTLPSLEIPQGLPGPPLDWPENPAFTPFDANGNINMDGFVDLGYIADDGLTMRGDLWLRGDPTVPSEADLRTST